MLQNWLEPLNSSIYRNITPNADQFIIGNVQSYVDVFPNLTDVNLVLLGIGNEGIDRIRDELYALPFTFQSITFADIGNIKKKNKDFYIPVLKELNQGKIIPIIIGEDREIISGIVTAYAQLMPKLSVCFVDEYLNSYHNNYPKALFESEFVFHQSFIGIQNHLLTKDEKHFINSNFIDTLRLSKVRENVKETEPSIRNADALFFMIDALKKAEAPGMISNNSNGLFSEEACQICRYAGFSDKVTALIINGYKDEKDFDGQTSNLIAQMIWYFMDGFDNRAFDYPFTKDGLVEYVVTIKDSSANLVFWMSKKTKRWWLQVTSKNIADRHKLIPCSLEDYKLATSGELSQRVMNTLNWY